MQPMTRQILILGGTSEAVALATALHGRGHRTVTSLAGRTPEPGPVPGTVRSGGFGGVDGLARWLRTEPIAAVVDATHPFAERITANAASACRTTGTPLIRLDRPPWRPVEGDDWMTVPDIGSAVDAVPEGAVALLALGRQHIAPFAASRAATFIVRSIEPVDALGTDARTQYILSRPSGDPAVEKQFMRRHRVNHVVSRNSGGTVAYGKIAAARSLGLRVTMIGRRPAPAGLRTVDDWEGAVSWLEQLPV